MTKPEKQFNKKNKIELSFDEIIEIIGHYLDSRCSLWCPCGFGDGTIATKEQLLKHLKHIFFWG